MYPTILLAIAMQAAPVATVPDRFARAFERFRDLPSSEQERIASVAEQRALELDFAPCRNAVFLLAHADGLPKLSIQTNRVYRPDRFAPNLKQNRKAASSKSSRMRRANARFLLEPAPVPGESWLYDYGRNGLIPLRNTPTAEERLLAIANGRLPELDRQRAAAAAILDDLKERDAVADYFEHTYVDRDGWVYPGIRLYDAWNSGNTLEVSDVEAIAWLRLVEQDESVESPIAARLHDEIYSRIGEEFAVWRRQRVLRDSLASVLVDPDAPLPVWLANSNTDFARLWAVFEDDPERVLSMLGEYPDRDALLEAVRETVEERDAEGVLFQAWVAQHVELRAALMTTLDELFAEEMLTGLRRRF